MSSISTVRKLKDARTVVNPNLPIFLALAVALVLAFQSAIAPTSGAMHSDAAYRQYRLGEWASIPVHYSMSDAYLAYRGAEVISSLPSTQAYQLFRLGEVQAATAANLAAYHSSERTLVDSQAGMAIYLQSERTSLPMRFTTYQRSEWFGE
jgi:hypothetical protein